jgi:DNA helicase-2/ATP-dependent DNA helicase PcrA
LKIFKQEQELFDFNDMLEYWVREGVRPNIDVLLVDEAQDQSRLQWQVVDELSKLVRRFVIGGDDDQAIFEWGGADIERFIKQEGITRVLTQSFRVPKRVQELSSNIINRCSSRRDKYWNPRGELGIVDYSNYFDSNICSSGTDILVLVRNTIFLRNIIEPELRLAGYLYEKNGQSSMKQSWMTTIKNWERLRQKEKLFVSDILPIYDLMTSSKEIKAGYKKLPGFNDQEMYGLDQLKDQGGLLTDAPWFEALSRIPKTEVDYLRAARRRGENTNSPRIRISTIHRAKGGEADHVILLKDMARRTHVEMDKNSDAEHRVWYVGATRAKNRLTIVDAQTKKSYLWI